MQFTRLHAFASVIFLATAFLVSYIAFQIGTAYEETSQSQTTIQALDALAKE